MSTEYTPPIQLDNGGIELDTTPDHEGDLELIATMEDMHVAYLRPADQVAVRDLMNKLHPPQPRTVNTVEELEALPNESLILDAQKSCREGLTSVEGRNWWRTMGPAKVLPSEEIQLPATVLYEGEATLRILPEHDEAVCSGTSDAICRECVASA